MNAHSLPGAPKTDERIESRRRQILDAASRVIAERGFHGATIRRIAAAAGVAEGTIYNYFADKTELLFGLLDRLNESAERPAALDALGGSGAGVGDLRRLFEEQVRHRLEHVGERSELLRALLPELLHHPELRHRYRDEIVEPTLALAEHAFAALAAAGALEPIDAPLVVRLVAGMVFGTVMLALLGDPVLAARGERLPGEIVALLFDGLGRPGAEA